LPTHEAVAALVVGRALVEAIASSVAKFRFTEAEIAVAARLALGVAATRLAVLLRIKGAAYCFIRVTLPKTTSCGREHQTKADISTVNSVEQHIASDLKLVAAIYSHAQPFFV
jgi:hypothetical protein